MQCVILECSANQGRKTMKVIFKAIGKMWIWTTYWAIFLRAELHELDNYTVVMQARGVFKEKGTTYLE